MDGLTFPNLQFPHHRRLEPGDLEVAAFGKDRRFSCGLIQKLTNSTFVRANLRVELDASAGLSGHTSGKETAEIQQ